jgi:N-acetylmuramoyl-L-alanine amidase
LIAENLIRKNPFSRPGYERPETLGIVFHYTGASGQENKTTRRYFELLADQDLKDDRPDRYASAHYITGIDGSIIKAIPENEVAYHVGARSYSKLAFSQFPEYILNRKRSTPNWCTIGIELCHPDSTGAFSEETLKAGARLGGYLLLINKLSTNDVYRHYDITEKNCPKFFVQHEEEWSRFLREIKKEKEALENLL